ncbi:MAG: T9SS type A sorting domain-containing protein, partial [Flavobacteriales bacterium]|nr:T9SS type A sorting domain-containing protein [Flavobacteriales bacterium]
PWHIYELPGNPRDTLNWSDYPAISITEKDLFLTINMIIPNVSWQLGFDGTVIWQMDLDQAFAGDTATQVTWWDNIKWDGRYIRNLNPITYGMEPDSVNAFFVSNRNFDLNNDTIFLLEVTNSLSSGQAQLNIKQGRLDLPYGMPPNGRQADTDTTDASTGLQTNDARWLGGFILEDRIQFVGNSINHDNGNASIYHGIIENVYQDKPVFKGHIISDPILDFGYPNIVFTGNKKCEQQAIIAFNHTSMNDFPGTSTVYFSNEGRYSMVTRMKSGQGIIDNPPLENDPYERWGDYFGLQRVYDNPGEVWSSGMWGLTSKRSATWISQIQSPDTHEINMSVDTVIDYFNNCKGILNVSTDNGVPPYMYIFNQDTVNSNELSINVCEGQYTLTIKDSLNCSLTNSYNFSDSIKREVIDVQMSSVYPNPFSDQFQYLFETDTEKELLFVLYDDRGRLVQDFGSRIVQEGMNALTFSTIPLESGLYFIKVFDDDGFYHETKLLKLSN